MEDYEIEERKELDDLLNGKRFCCISLNDPFTQKYAQEHNFEVVMLQDFPGLGYKRCGVGVRKRVKEIPLPDFSIFPEYKEEITKTVHELGYLSVAQALRVVDTRILTKKNEEKPVDVILMGVFFGYPICDIRYYVDTRILKLPQHSLEDDVPMHPYYRILCEECAKKALS